jgi:hypothetical protein
MRQTLIVDSCIELDLADVPSNAEGTFTIKGSEPFDGDFTMEIYQDGDKVYEEKLNVNDTKIKVSIKAKEWKLDGRYFEYKIIGTLDGIVKNYLKGKMTIV